MFTKHSTPIDMINLWWSQDSREQTLCHCVSVSQNETSHAQRPRSRLNTVGWNLSLKTETHKLTTFTKAVLRHIYSCLLLLFLPVLKCPSLSSLQRTATWGCSSEVVLSPCTSQTNGGKATASTTRWRSQTTSSSSSGCILLPEWMRPSIVWENENQWMDTFMD